MKTIKRNFRNIFTLISAIVLFITSILHSFQFNLENINIYKNSIYINIEIISMLISVGMIFIIGFFTIIAYIINKDWKNLFITFVFLGSSLILYLLALKIDYQTLIYIT